MSARSSRACVLALATALFCAQRSAAADSECYTTYQSGAWSVVECFICDGDHSATDCAELSLLPEVDGWPEAIIFDLSATTGCAGAVQVAVRGLSDQLGVPHVYGTLSAAGTSTLPLFETRHRFIDADVDITTSAGCTDLEVRARFLYRRFVQ